LTLHTRELSVAGQRYQALQAVIGEGRTITEVAAQWRVSRQTVHAWLARYQIEGLEGLRTDLRHPFLPEGSNIGSGMVLRRVRGFWRWSALVAGSTLFLTGCQGGPHKANPPPPPAGFFYYREAANPDKLVRIDWEGKPTGGLALRGKFRASPDGSRLLLPGGQVMTAEGHMLSAVPANSVWADDSRHLCAILDADGNPANQPLPGQAVNGVLPMNPAYPPAFVYTLSSGETPHRVAPVPSFSRGGGPEVAACSLRSDTAVITYDAMAFRWVAQVTRLSDGVQLLGQSDYQVPYVLPNFTWVIAVSPDGRLVVVENVRTRSKEMRRLPDGEILGQLPYARVLGFSADGTRLVIRDVPPCGTSGFEECGPPVVNSHSNMRTVRVIEWRTDREIWSADGYQGSFAARPGSSQVAVNVCLDPRCSSSDVWLIGDRSTPRRIATQVGS
jgi:hypothetical protein